MIDLELIKQQAKYELARREFWYYCQLTAPDFYTDDRAYLKKLCDECQDFIASEDDVMVIAAPPRHGKSRTASKLVEWIFGEYLDKKVMTGSYNETLSTVFSKGVRNTIMEIKADSNKIVYADIFPKTKIQRGDGAMNLWSLEGGYNNYLATSPTGSATGFGANILIIDDIIKNSMEAYNDDVLQKHWDWFTGTMLSRLEENGKIMIFMTRWSTLDLAGRAIEHFSQEGMRIRQLTLKALQDDGTMLCPSILSRRSYDLKIGSMGIDIASANYQQEPINIRGKLYNRFKTYDETPKDDRGNEIFTAISAYIDTADEGSDYLSAGVYGEYNKESYLLDVEYTHDPMETTEMSVAKMLVETKCSVAYIESNNGGRGFARAVERIMRETLHSNRCRIVWFHQSKNKKARILSNATWVMDHIYVPRNWADRWPEFYTAMNTYQRDGKNKHDDAPDMMTGIAEHMTTRSKGPVTVAM